MENVTNPNVTNNEVTKKSTKPATKKSTKENAKVDFNSLFEGLITVKSGKNGSENSVYKSEIFSGMTQDLKKKARTKLRRQRDKFLSAFINAKGDKNTLKAIQKDWKKYAVNIYKSIDIICESNTDSETANLCKKFVSIMNNEIK